MKIVRFLRIFAVLVLVATVAFWAMAGANTSMTNRVVKDASSPQGREHFSPGIEFLAGNGLFAVVLFGASFLPCWGARKQ